MAFPEILSEWDYEANTLDPHRVAPKGRAKVHWVCSDGHKWVASVNGRTSGGNGCPECVRWGFNPALAGKLYILRGAEGRFYKVGITNTGAKTCRIRQHERRGFVCVETFTFKKGELARSLETEVLRILRQTYQTDRAAYEAAFGTTDGYSEAFKATGNNGLIDGLNFIRDRLRHIERNQGRYRKNTPSLHMSAFQAAA